MKLLKLYTDFLKFGSYTFGGGWSIVAQMKDLYVDKEKIITNEDLFDLTSIGRSLPGTMIGNIAMFFGYRMAGFFGGLACVFGMITAPAVVLILITTFYTAFQHNLWVYAAMKGIRSAVAPIIFAALSGMIKSAFKFPPCYFVTLLAFGLFFYVNCVWLVVIGAVLGIFISELHERKALNKEGAIKK